MQKNIKAKREEGFTIIEVLIVLAIAGIIMLIVFLAVPALQRNNRNTQRSNDAARVASAINECLPNNNGDLNDCDDPTEAELSSYINTNADDELEDNQQLINFVDGELEEDNLDTVYFRSGHRCDGNDPEEVEAARAFVVLYNVETTGDPAPRCVGS